MIYTDVCPKFWCFFFIYNSKYISCQSLKTKFDWFDLDDAALKVQKYFIYLIIILLWVIKIKKKNFRTTSSGLNVCGNKLVSIQVIFIE